MSKFADRIAKAASITFGTFLYLLVIMGMATVIVLLFKLMVGVFS